MFKARSSGGEKRVTVGTRLGGGGEELCFSAKNRKGKRKRGTGEMTLSGQESCEEGEDSGGKQGFFLHRGLQRGPR